MIAETELHHLRRAVAVSYAAREHGNHPFGAVLVDPSGSVVLEAENTVNTGHDVTHHAELNLVRLACASIAYADLPRHTLLS
jgi:tRNA(Arg) A34 adenosine deaminase TadA